MISSLDSHFLDKLREIHTSRKPINEVRDLFLSVYQPPQETLDRLLLQKLSFLEQEKCISTPNTTEALLPSFIKLEDQTIPVKTSTPKFFDPRVMRIFFDKKTQKTQNLIAALVKIDNYLTRNQNFPPTTIRELSYKIFGHEKTLDGYHDKNTGNLFGLSYLKLKDLNAQYRPPPLAFTKVSESESKDVLILENCDTYWTYTDWNQKTKKFAGTVLGRGQEINASYILLDEIFANHRFFYLGDLDPTGLRILGTLMRNSQELPTFIVDPYLFGYRAMLHPTFQRLSDESTASISPIEIASIFYSDTDLTNDICELFAKKQRIPQEALTIDFLLSLI